MKETPELIEFRVTAESKDGHKTILDIHAVDKKAAGQDMINLINYKGWDRFEYKIISTLPLLRGNFSEASSRN